jgi:AraC family transcriptional regulator of adaptative response/methylated-DNA-[protein]-cysteine methyltransferase
MINSTPSFEKAQSRIASVIVPLIRTAATIGFIVAPCSLGFVIIAVSDHLIRSIMVGDDPEQLVGDLQRQFPHNRIEVAALDDELAARVVDLIDRPDSPARN